MFKDLLVNYKENTKIEEIEYSGARTNGTTIERYIYNPSVIQPLQKFWYMIANCKLENRKFVNGKCIVNIVTTRKDKNLIKSLKSLNSHIDGMITKYNANNKPIDKLVTISNNYPPTITATIDDSSVILTKDGDTTKIRKLNSGSRVMVLLEFVKVVFDTTRISKVWRVVQMKEIPTIDISKDIFSFDNIQKYNTDESILSTASIAPPPPRNMPPPPPIPTHHNSASQSQPSPNRMNLMAEITGATLKKSNTKHEPKPEPKSSNSGGGFFPPTKDQLANMRAQLKSRNKPKVDENNDVETAEDTKVDTVEDTKVDDTDNTEVVDDVEEEYDEYEKYEGYEDYDDYDEYEEYEESNKFDIDEYNKIMSDYERTTKDIDSIFDTVNNIINDEYEYEYESDEEYEYES
jgi:hypothetical protein